MLVLALAYFCGGYVTGRMSRFEGMRQGHRDERAEREVNRGGRRRLKRKG